jgi:UDP-N-acetyl-D-mannosaminuronic acid transferase (WecB/TagA/CpsF family)
VPEGGLVRRRDFISLVSSVAAWPLAARAQQPAMPVIGYLSGATFEMMRDYVAAFHRGLADEGFAEGRNVGIEYRWTEGHNDRLPALAADLVRRQVAVIVVGAAHQVRWLPRQRLRQSRSYFMSVPTQSELVASRASRTPAATSLGLLT